MEKNSRSAQSPLVNLSAVVCRIGARRELRIPELTLTAGQYWCVFGANGSGKSLLVRLLGGRLRPGAGTVNWGTGLDPRQHLAEVSFEEQQRRWIRDDRRDISEFSADAMDAGTTVLDLVLDGRTNDALNQARLKGLLATLGLENLVNQGLRYLSSGQVRRALIARAVWGLNRGYFRIGMLDDPLESIDKDSVAAIQGLFAIAGESACVVHVCRRVGDIPAATTHIALMDKLQLVEHGPKDQVLTGANFRRLTAVTPGLASGLPSALAGMPPVPGGQILVELKSVNAGYGGHQVLSNLSWELRSGQHVLIEGPNGCGKSTLLSLIDGENHKAYGQQVFLFGRRRGSGESVWDVKSCFGVVSNEIHNRYIKGWKVLDVVVSGFFSSVGLYQDPGAAQIAAARQWLQCVGIGGLEKSSYHELSFGQQRLTLLARAMVKGPAVLILDEPCVGLDDRHRRHFLELIDKIAEETSTTMIYVSHARDGIPNCIVRRYRFLGNGGSGYTLVEAD